MEIPIKKGIKDKDKVKIKLKRNKKDIMFRAWLKGKKEEKMVEVIEIDFMVRSIKYIDDNFGILPTIFEDIELMQSTGFSDKKGIPIFEGDILKFKDYSIDKTEKFYNVGLIGRVGITDEIKINNFLYQNTVFTKNYTKKINNLFIIKHCEIIGNIFANPELLNKKA